MGGSPGDVSEEPVMQEKRKKGWRMSCDVGEAMVGLDNEFSHSPNFPPLHLRHSSFSNTSVALPTSQLILQPFRCFTYVTAHSATLLLLLLRHRLFNYVTWRAAHAFLKILISRKLSTCYWKRFSYDRASGYGLDDPEIFFTPSCADWSCGPLSLL